MEIKASSEPATPLDHEGLPSLMDEETKLVREPRRRMRTTKYKALTLPIDLKLASSNSFKSYKISDDYHLMEKIGFGTYSEVRKGIHKKNEQKVAVKISRGTTSCNFLLNEADILKEVSSEYLPKFYSFVKDEAANRAYLVMEYIEGQSLDCYIRENGTISESEANNFLLMLITAVAKLHAKGIAHRDIKPQNILITPDKQLKLIDFNISKKKKEKGDDSDDERDKFK